MAQVTQLARMLSKLEDDLTGCMRCGLCQSVCPLYEQTGREADVARGKLALLDGLAQEILKEPDGAKERVERCLLCGACQANCPSGVNTQDLFLRARAILNGYLGLPPAKKFIFRNILAKPALFNRLLSWGGKLQGLAVKPASDLLGTSCGRIPWPLGERHFKALARTPLNKTLPWLDEAPQPGKPTVALFVGCLIDKIYPQVGLAALKVLRHHGMGIWMPPGQACCGIPALSSGDTRAFRGMLRQNLELFRPDDFDYLVTACATCTSVIKEMWPQMGAEAGSPERDILDKISAKTMDISQLFTPEDFTQTGADVSPDQAAQVSYHDPCHLKKSLGVAAQPRAMLSANHGYRLREMPEPDACCGMGGSFNLQHYKLSQAIGGRKLDSIKDSGSRIVATGCPACMLQISDLLSQAGEPVEVKHYLELYAEGI